MLVNIRAYVSKLEILFLKGFSVIKKFLISVALASAFGSVALFGADYSTEGKEKITRNGVNVFLAPNSPNKQKYLGGEFDKALEEAKKAYKKQGQKQVRASAPNVYYVAILGVISEKGGREELSEGQTITNNDHGGNPFVVHTIVLGYGGMQYDTATFAGNQAKQLSSDCLDLTGDNICDGWYDIWDISYPVNSSGNFIFTSRSVNSITTKLSTSLQIR